ncbi:MAG: TerB family tellurite resistance protein [Alphaproteobacteria bacterium]|nr:TerB family tellurite resistance protein [Alphaproteobacteria bacterium]
MQLRKTSPLRMLAPLRAISGARYQLQKLTHEPTHAPEKAKEEAAKQPDPFRHLSFTFALIALSARIATESGNLTRDHYLAFRAAFPLSGGICGKLRKLFVLACENSAPAEHYALQVKHLFPRQMDLFISLVDRLFGVALAGGHLSKSQERMLSRIAFILDISASEYSEIYERHMSPPPPHEVLGVSKYAGRSALKKRYHALMREFHPDLHASRETSPEVALILRLKASEINAAYQAMKG